MAHQSGGTLTYNPHRVDDRTFLRTVPLLVEFDDLELDRIGAGLERFTFNAGELILEEGMPNRALHIVHDGRVRVSRKTAGSHLVALSDLIAGQTFGELSILEDGFATATLHAIPPTTILSLSIDQLAELIRDSPVTGNKFWRAVALELRRRLLASNEVVRSYFEVNRSLLENESFRKAYALCNQ